MTQKTLKAVVATIFTLTAAAVMMTGCATMKTPTTVADVQELESYLEELAGRDRKSPPGISLVVVKGNDIVYKNAFGLADGPRNKAATPDTVYNYWSMTKPFTAVAILQLAEQGRIKLDDPVTKHLPFFDVKYLSEDNEIITIRHLLNHSSGLKNNVPEIIGWVHTTGGKEWNQTELLKDKFPRYTRLRFETGSEARYTNVGYMVLAAIIEVVTRQTYEDYIRERILKPLKMSQTNFFYTDSMIPDEAVGSHPRFDFTALLLPFFVNRLNTLILEKTGGVIWFNPIYSDQKGPTGLIGPATDVAKFIMAYLNGGELEGARILSETSVNLMTTQHHVKAGKTPESRSYGNLRHGISWFVRPYEGGYYLSHSGGGPGFASSMRIYPKRDLGMVIMANGTYLDRVAILDLVASIEW